MAKKQLSDLYWHDNRFLILLVFALVVSGGFYLFSLLFLVEEKTLKSYVDENGCEVYEYYHPYSQNPFEIVYYDLDGNFAEKWYDRNTNGHFESKSYFTDEVIIKQLVSLNDDGNMNLHRYIVDNEIIEEYDRNSDSLFEEKHYFIKLPSTDKLFFENKPQIGNFLRVKNTIDRDGDGNFEQQVFYDDKGKAVKLILDHDSDGIADVILPQKRQPNPKNKSGTIKNEIKKAKETMQK